MGVGVGVVGRLDWLGMKDLGACQWVAKVSGRLII